MRTLLRPPSLVTVLTITPFDQVLLSRFQVEHEFRPIWTDPSNVYSDETHREGFTVRDLVRSAPVDYATWLHRSGLWDKMPEEP